METKSSKTSFYISVLLFLAMALGLAMPTQTALASTPVYVNPDGVCGGNSPCFTTIQAAITAVDAGGTVHVAAGTYNEQVIINKGLTIDGVGDTTIIQPSQTTANSFTLFNRLSGGAINSTGVVVTDTTASVTLSNLKIDGSLVASTPSSARFMGILYRGTPGLIDSVTVQNIGLAESNAILLSGYGSPVAVTVTSSTVTGYNKNGITANNPGLTATISGNTITGIGATSAIAQNGIQIGFGATGTLSSNTISGNVYTGNSGVTNDPATDANADGAAGILLYMPAAGIEIHHNTLTANQFGIWSVAAPDVNIHDNTITGLAHTGFAFPTGIAIGSADQWVDDFSGTEQATIATITNNTISTNDYGLLVLDYTAGGVAPSVTVTGNNFSNNDTQAMATGSSVFGVATTLTGNTFDRAVTVDHLGALLPAIWGKIQLAINAATTGDTVNVAAGTYAEDLTIDKSLTLLGPNSAINPNTGTRVGEAVLHPATSNPDPAVCTVMAYLSVSNITIKGFTFDGDNPSLNSGIMIGTADVDACEIMAGYEGMGNIVVENNILKSSTYSGVDFYNDTNPAATSSNYIRYNLFEDIGETTYNWGIGVLIYNNFYADITDNVFTGVRTGIQTGNFSAANPGTTGSISNNEIGTWRLGIFHNLAYSNATALTLSNNTITAENYPGATKWNGILLSSIGSAVNATVSSNVISIPVAVSGSRTPTTGYNIWNMTTSAPLTISGGSVTGGQYGVWVNNFEGYASDAGNTSIIVDGLSISGASIAGINVWDSPSNTNSATVSATLNNNVITTSALGVQISGSDATSNGTCNQISGNTAGLNNTTAALLTFEKNWWGSVSGPSGTGLGSGDTVSANVDYQPWNTNTTCTAFTSNISPVANAQSVSTAEDTAKAITLTGTDADGGTLTYSVVAGPLHGTLSGTAPALTYTPAANYNGSDSFTFKVNDGTADSNIATVSITVTAVNDTPIITEGASINVTMSASTPFSLTLNATDANSDTITWSINTAAGHGTASASGTGTSKAITYTPTLNYIGSDSFVVQVSDGVGGTDTIIVNVTITAVEPPTFTIFLPLILH